MHATYQMLPGDVSIANRQEWVRHAASFLVAGRAARGPEWARGTSQAHEHDSADSFFSGPAITPEGGRLRADFALLVKSLHWFRLLPIGPARPLLNIVIMRAFVKLREMIAHHKEYCCAGGEVRTWSCPDGFRHRGRRGGDRSSGWRGKANESHPSRHQTQDRIPPWQPRLRVIMREHEGVRERTLGQRGGFLAASCSGA
jgi:hypothetical protein